MEKDRYSRIIEKIANGLIRRWKKAVIIVQCLLSCETERKEIAGFLLHYKGLTAYPYAYARKYDQTKVNVTWDADGYPYVIHSGKRLYLKKSWSKEKCQRYYNNLRIEQDRECSHCYLGDPERYPDKDDIVADIGAAEGIFGLDIIDSVARLYLMEGDRDWDIPLSKTFMPWKEKVVIVDKYLSDSDHDDYVTLDEYFKGKQVTYLKADIEGDEEKMLRGAGRLLDSTIRKALICTYHNADDEKRLKTILKNYGFVVKINEGYLLWTNVDHLFSNSYLRRGVLFAMKLQ